MVKQGPPDDDDYDDDERGSSPWQRDRTYNNHQQQNGLPPPVPPKPQPQGRMVYLFENPDGTTSYHEVRESPMYMTSRSLEESRGGGGTWGGERQSGYDSSPEVRIRERNRGQGKGYNLLAKLDKTPSSSRGGRMFIKQQQRMKQFTSAPQPGRGGFPPPEPPPRRCASSFEPRGSPWTATSPGGDRMYNHALTRDGIRRGAKLAPMPEPPAQWRARVEANFRLGDSPEPPWSQQQQRGPGGGGGGGGIPTATINFNARLYRAQPHRKQRPQDGFKTTPHAHLDFNPRPVGWTRKFVDEYTTGHRRG